MPIAVVTGSSSGIGLATATALVRQGYSLVLHCRQSLSQLEIAAAELSSQLSSNASLRCITADLSCSQACRRLVQACFHWQSHIDLWVNNAGADVLTGAENGWSFDAKLKRLWEVDVLGTIRLSRLVASRIIEKQRALQDRAIQDVAPVEMSMANSSGAASKAGAESGKLCENPYSPDPPPVSPCIINIGWDQALLGMEGEAGELFCPTKAAVTAFSSALSLSVAPHLRVNVVAPGWIRTNWGSQSASPYWNARAIHESQLERWGTPQDVAEAICWIASPSASFITGQTICVNGGRRFYTPSSGSAISQLATRGRSAT